MGKSFNRREFLKSSIKSITGIALLGSPLKIFSTPLNDSSAKTAAVALTDPSMMYKQAKDHFYKKEYSAAIGIYQQLTTNYPEKIIYYDGYAKVLGAQQNMLAVAELYRNGLQNNPSSPHFKHRFSLCLRNLCVANRKAETAFVNKYGQTNLMALSATLLIEAVSLKHIKGYIMDLKDLPVIIDKINKKNTNNKIPQLSIGDSLINDINNITSSVNTKWNDLRKSQKPSFKNIDAEVEQINNKNRRELYFQKEKDSRDKETKKEKKNRWKKALADNIKSNDIYKIEKYSTFILSDNMNDTNTIGLLRKYYLKSKAFDRIISFNRNLYVHNTTYVNALALAGALTKYGNSSSLTEAKQLLDEVKPYANTLSVINTTSYYLTLSQYYIKLNQPDNARNTLLDGLKLYDGRGGVSYSLLENYAMTYFKSGTIDTGIGIMKLLCDKPSNISDLIVQQFITNYKESVLQKKQPVSVQEQLKMLRALAKLQKKAGSSEYNSTLSEINALKAGSKTS